MNTSACIIKLTVVINFFNRHLILSKRSSFITRNDIRAAEGFNSRQFTDQCMALGHFLRTQC